INTTAANNCFAAQRPARNDARRAGELRNDNLANSHGCIHEANSMVSAGRMAVQFQAMLPVGSLGSSAHNGECAAAIMIEPPQPEYCVRRSRHDSPMRVTAFVLVNR